MSDVVHRQRGRGMLDVLGELDAEYADILALFDRQAAARRMVANVPEQIGRAHV